MIDDDIPKPSEAKALFAEWTADYAARKESGDTLADILGGGARRELLDKVRLDFHELGEQLLPGVLAVLEASGVSPEARQAVGEYLGDVVKGLNGVGREVLKLADRPGAEQAGYYAMFERTAKEQDGIER